MEKYVVSIIKENKELTGIVNYVMNFKINNRKTKSISSVSKKINFIPTSVLCDLSSFLIDNKNNDDDIFETYNKERAFNDLIIDKSADTYYFAFAKYIKDIILSNAIPDLKKLEEIRIYYNIKLDYTISYKKRNDKKEINQYKKCEDEYIPLQFGFASVEEKDNKESYKYIYNCSNLTEVLFAILHCLIMNRYNKIKKCNHCGGLFFYNHEKQKYCQRKSPYKNYEKHNCEQAVRNIKKKFADRKKSIYTTLNNYHGENLYKFMDDWDELRKIVDECSSVENLKKLEKFSSKENIKKNYY